jgi:hypothetical protein
MPENPPALDVQLQRVSLPETAMPARQVILRPGTLLSVRIAQTLSSAHDRPGDRFSGVLNDPLVIDGFLIADRGASAEGTVVAAKRGTAALALQLDNFTTTDGQTVKLRTDTFAKASPPSKEYVVETIAEGAAIGAIIGAAAGSGKGAGIGAAIGGAAGAGDVIMTHGKPAVLPTETLVSFRVWDPVTITEQR